MNEDIHPIIQQIKDNILNLIAGESIRLLKASTVDTLHEVLDWINKYENKDFENANIYILQRLLSISSKLQELEIILNNKNIKNKSNYEDRTINDINRVLTSLDRAVKKTTLKDLSDEKKNKLLKAQAATDISCLQEQIAECKQELKAYEQSLEDRRARLDGLEEVLERKAEDIEAKLEKSQEKMQLNHSAFSERINLELNNLLNNIYEEQLAEYFHKECTKLKGEIQPPVIVAAIVIDILIMNCIFKQELCGIKEYILVAVVLLGVFSGSILILDGLFEFIKQITRKIPDKFKKDFKLRTVNGLMTPYWCWLAGVFVGMGGIFAIALDRYLELKSKSLTLTAYLENVMPSIGLCLILIWFTWFCSKQFSYTKQICDEYEYKYALSKSYLRYRDEAKELGETTSKDILLASLLDAVIKNIATSPVAVY